MITKQPYSYVVLRYVHDIVTSEFVNVGIVLLCPREGLLLAKTRKTIGRIKAAFPDLDRHAFMEAMTSLDRGIKKLTKRVKTEGLFSEHNDAASYARLILKSDDSSLQWSPVGVGITDNANKTLERLFTRFVARYDIAAPKRKSDEDVWRPVKEMLTERGVKLDLEPKVVSSRTDSIEFKRAWKNGRWHVYEPLSFDLTDADGIKDKARRWRGHLAAVAEDAREDLQLYFLIGRPENKSLLDAYRNAIDILRGSPFAPEVFEDSDVEILVNNIEDELRNHQDNRQ